MLTLITPSNLAHFMLVLFVKYSHSPVLQSRVKDSDLREKSITPQQYGAKGDGKHDDTQAFLRCFRSNSKVVVPKAPKFYLVSGQILIANVTNLSVRADKAIILCNDLSKPAWLFQKCKDVVLTGGEWGYVKMPVTNGGNNQHTLQFDQCENILLSKSHIRNSPEIGIAITQCYGITIENSWIEHTWRDGTYAHYSAKIKYINNKYSDCKDDAMSFHDYGRDAERQYLMRRGIHQASGLVIDKCQVKNCYQGFGSVAGADMVIKNSMFSNTVLAGIALMNQKLLYPDGVTRLKNVQVLNNKCVSNCSKTIINKKVFINGGQASSGRAAIICASLGDNNQIGLTEPKRQSNIKLINNYVSSSGAIGLGIYSTDNIVLSGNTFKDCIVTGNTLGGAVVEIWECTKYAEGKTNKVIDTRNRIQHQRAYNFSGLQGTVKKWTVINRTVEDGLIDNSPSLKKAY
ncbi:right-handed parallel beta-helix repeat-containing protein [Fibrella aestuarina]|nr:right-handed parallel beta-helix repeat-containing protein [Fibrella aestuarina]